jgi:hypothetical protein
VATCGRDTHTHTQTHTHTHTHTQLVAGMVRRLFVDDINKLIGMEDLWKVCVCVSVWVCVCVFLCVYIYVCVCT